MWRSFSVVLHRFVMQSPILSSTFFLTLLMMIGLVFFIRASTKERIEVVQFALAQPLEESLAQLQSYFLERSYESVGDNLVSDSDPSVPPTSSHGVEPAPVKQIFEGMVRPSVFMAVLLFVLASIGFLCLALVLSILLPQLGAFVWLLVLLSPAASLFYWKKSSRLEQVSFKVEALPLQNIGTQGSSEAPSQGQATTETKVTVMGHRDELASLQQAFMQKSLPFRALEADFG